MVFNKISLDKIAFNEIRLHGLSQFTRLHFILSHVTGIFKPTVRQPPFAGSQNMLESVMLEFPKYFCNLEIPMIMII